MTAVPADAPDPDADRRAALRTLGRGVGAVAGGCLGGMAAGLLATGSAGARVTRADVALDIRMLQTASSLETLVVDLYGAALGTGPLGANAPAAVALAAMPDTVARDTLVRVLSETQAQHREHRLAFQALTKALGGKEQNDPNPKYASGVAAADVASPLRLVDYAAVLEKILTDTYIEDLTLAESVKAKETLASVMAVEAQHLALLRAVGALLRGGTTQLVRIPIGADLPNLPATLAAIA
ncbi:MAG TPA: ferritin-like domain-containing protein, partial [Acidimicrobiales bacterium]